MKKGKYKKFNNRSGIAKIEHDSEGECYVVYGNISKIQEDKEELGEVLGKGKTEEEAMENAIICLVDLILNTANKFDEVKSWILSSKSGFEKGILPKNQIVLPVAAEEYIYDSEGFYSGTSKNNQGKVENARVYDRGGEVCVD